MANSIDQKLPSAAKPRIMPSSQQLQFPANPQRDISDRGRADQGGGLVRAGLPNVRSCMSGSVSARGSLGDG